MYLQLTTGKDSFRPQGISSRRNVSVQTFVRLSEPDEDGRLVVPLFAAFQRKRKGLGETQLVQTIPATSMFSANDAGQWFVNRHEVTPGTEILIEYRHLNPRGGFGEGREHLLIVADPNAALLRVRLELPYHALSAVPYVFFEGRFSLLKDDSELSKAAKAAWVKFMGVELDDGDGNPIMLADYMDPAQSVEDQFFHLTELEAAVRQTEKVIVTEDENTGKQKIRIRRLRNIKVR